MKLIPRKFKIDQDKNEHTYYIEWKKTEKGDKWFITMYDGATFLVAGDLWSSWPKAEYGYDTPEKALERFDEYIYGRDNQNI